MSLESAGDYLYECIWSERFWLPQNVTWSDFKSSPGKQYPDMYWLLKGPLVFGIFLLFVRWFFENYVFLPIGKFLGIRCKPKHKIEGNPILQNFFSTVSTRPNETEVSKLSKKCDLSPNQIARWFALRRRQEKSSTMDKFCEVAWRFMMYSIVCVYGICIMIKKEWVHNPDGIYVGWPLEHYVDDDIKLYYLLELGFYISLFLTVVRDVKRRDFWAMAAHHIVTIIVMVVSWIVNGNRTGAWVLFLDDPSDVLLEAAKLARYTKHQILSNVLFFLFAVIWFVTRNILYPCIVLYRTMWRAYFSLGETLFGGFIVFNVLLTIIFLLQVYWSYLIGMVVVRAVTGGDAADVRSDSEEDEEDDRLCLLTESGEPPATNGSNNS